MARNALSFSSSSSSSTGGIQSHYARQKRELADTENKDKMKGACPKCDKEFYLYKFFQSTKRWNERPFTTCIDCKPQLRRKDDRKSAKTKTSTTDGEAGGMYSSMGALTDDIHFERPINHFSGNMKPTSISRNSKSQRR